MNDFESSAEIEPSNRPSQRRRLAILVSVVVHVVIAVALLFIYLPQSKPARVAESPASESGSESDDNLSARQPPAVAPPSPIDDVPPEQIEDSIQSQIDRSNRLSDDEKLSELEKNLRRLNSISDQQSVNEVTETIADTLGLDSRAYASDKTPAEGRFDFDSAQLEDVTRQRGEDGSWIYQSVLVDGEGRKMSVPMGADGEPMYRAFEQMKKYPIAESIYRSVVMPMLQSLLEAEEAKRTGDPIEPQPVDD